VGPLPEETDWADFALARFAGDEMESVRTVKEEAGRAVLDIAASGLDAAMNIYNRRAEP
jgi:peptidyl-tRNA hydrolase